MADRPSRSARSRVHEMPPFMAEAVQVGRAAVEEPLRGITTDGVLRDVLSWPLTHDRCSEITEAGIEVMESLTPDQRGRIRHALDASEWRLWFNIHPNVLRHGVMLEDLTVAQRAAALRLLRATLSDRGYEQARNIMRINGFLAEVTGMRDDFGEWPYFLSIFGDPSEREPWGWQIDGHHLNLNVMVLGDRLSMTPSLMGSEPCRVEIGPLAGTEVMRDEQRAGLTLMRSLDDKQLEIAVQHSSLHPADLPASLNGPIDGRMQAGAFRDNAVIQTEGLRGDALSDHQRSLLRGVVGAFVGWSRDDYAEVKMAEVESHLDETWFTWMGVVGDFGPFYYRVQSPVALAEFDHHAGVVFDNVEPSRHHAHAILRVPNGGDYGADLLRRHHEQYDHGSGEHVPRSG